MSDRRASTQRSSGWTGDDRELELLAAAAIAAGTADLADDEHDDCNAALARTGGAAELEQLELAGGALLLADIESRGIEAMPGETRTRVAAALDRAAAGRTASDDPPPAPMPLPTHTGEPESKHPGGSKLFASLGWMAAAAAIAIAAVIVATQPDPTSPLTPEQKLAELMNRPGTLEWQFNPWGNAPDEEGFDADSVTGRVVWNNQDQEGYMVFEGLPPNDPRRYQYQLWIVVPEDEQGNPIDGGVFDVAQEEGPVIVPIDAKLAVENTPLAFGVTAEKPGGVVVSDQSRRVAIAAPDAG
jgi:hypothetical protein